MERLETFMTGTPLTEIEKSHLWALLAESMRAFGPGVQVTELLRPLRLSFGLSAEDTLQLQQYLSGRRSEFPFGAIGVDAGGRVITTEVL